MPTQSSPSPSLSPQGRGRREKYMLIDGNALIHRGFHAIPNLTNKAGEPTGAVYGFTSTLLKAIKDIKPTHIACTFDLAGPTFRHEKFKQYKAQRVKAPQELYDQIPRVKEVVRALNIPIFEKKAYEADDCLGTLATAIYNRHHSRPSKERQDNFEIVIVTGDLDTLQLVNHRIKVYTLRKGLGDTAVYDEKAVRTRYGLTPSQMVDFKALRGDPSDNIPGVKGIGEKGAIELVKEFGSVDELYRILHAEVKEAGLKIPNDKYQIPNKFQISKIRSRIINLLLGQEKEARMSYDLSVIDRKAPIETEVPKYEFTDANRRAVFKVFSELEFKSLLNKLPNYEVRSKSYEPPTTSLAEAASIPPRAGGENLGKQDYQLIDTEEKLEKALKELSKANEISIDTETTGLNPVDAKLVGIGLAAKPGRAYYVPSGLAAASEELKKLLANYRIKKIGHNLKYDLQILQSYSYNLTAASFDTMIASYLLNAGTRQHNLDAITFAELGYQMQPIEELIGKGKDQITMDRVPVEKVSWYCCEDVDATLRLKQVFEPQIVKEGLEKVFQEIEMPLVAVLAEMEMSGIKLDGKMLDGLAGEAEIEIKRLEKEIHKLTRSEFNIASPKQLKEVLFDKMGLVPIENRKTKTGISTAAGELEKMLGQHPVIPKILEYREVTKLYNTYLITLPAMVSKKTGRLHTNYNQTIAATGRLSSTDPNLQNIPVRGEGLGSEVRKAFVAEKGYKLLSLDYSQIELRIVAHLAQDKKMMAVFKKGEDIHEKTAMEIFGVAADKVTKDMRRDAKTINFGILYGVSSFGLSSRVGEMSRVEAKEFIEKYFSAYPAVADYIEQVKLQVNEEGFVRNELGRMRKFPEIKSSQFFVRAAAERAAVNFPIQSLAADVIKVAMINIHKTLSTEHGTRNTECQMLLQVHDELVFEVKEAEVAKWAKKLIPMMENAIQLSVPIQVEAKVGDNWGGMERIFKI
ncbi:MAG: DNA polymerase I [Candidatus Doudnabacteria bacterium]|nr:DNA polymerase I [Candidatus Doudnabacteria bacterium]